MTDGRPSQFCATAPVIAKHSLTRPTKTCRARGGLACRDHRSHLAGQECTAHARARRPPKPQARRCRRREGRVGPPDASAGLGRFCQPNPNLSALERDVEVRITTPWVGLGGMPPSIQTVSKKQQTAQRSLQKTSHLRTNSTDPRKHTGGRGSSWPSPNSPGTHSLRHNARLTHT